MEPANNARCWRTLLPPIPVLMAPGHSTDARWMERAERNSRSSVAISATTPCLATLYEPAPDAAMRPATDAVELICPPSTLRSIRGRNVLTP